MATYTYGQLEQYFRHINYPKSKHPQGQLQFLTELQRHHVARVPFDSVALHYSPHRLLSLDPEDLFQKIVVNSRGGYCMEVNMFFATILRSLSFDVYSAGGRVGHNRWNHMVNLVTLDTKKYFVDVGFGSKEPLQPVPLQDGYQFSSIAADRCKIQLKHLPQHTHQNDRTQRMWVYSTYDAAKGWEEMYSFTEMEFFPEDFEVMNHFVMTKPQSYFVQTLLAYRVTMNETGDLLDELILHKDSVKRKHANFTEVVEQLQNEEQRVRALEKYFFIRLTEREKSAIKGLASELKDAGTI